MTKRESGETANAMARRRAPKGFGPPQEYSILRGQLLPSAPKI